MTHCPEEAQRNGEREEEEVKSFSGGVLSLPTPQPRAKSTEENKERQQLIVEGGVDACKRVSAGCSLTV